MAKSIVIVKDLLWKGVREEFSNRWHFEGDSLPITQAEFDSFAQAFITAEKPTVWSDVRFKRALWYDTDGGDSVFTHAPEDFNAGNYPTGTLVTSGSGDAPAEAVCVLRHKTTKRAQGRPVYLFHFLHGLRLDTSDGDSVWPAQRTAIATFGGKLYDGTLSGTAKLCAPDGADVTAHRAAQFVSTRQLNKGRKRNPT